MTRTLNRGDGEKKNDKQYRMAIKTYWYNGNENNYNKSSFRPGYISRATLHQLTTFNYTRTCCPCQMSFGQKNAGLPLFFTALRSGPCEIPKVSPEPAQSRAIQQHRDRVDEHLPDSLSHQVRGRLGLDRTAAGFHSVWLNRQCQLQPGQMMRAVYLRRRSFLQLRLDLRHKRYAAHLPDIAEVCFGWERLPRCRRYAANSHCYGSAPDA